MALPNAALPSTIAGEVDGLNLNLGSLEILSHSYGDGYYSSDPQYLWYNRLARMVGADVVRNYSASGAKTYNPANGYGNVTEDVVRARQTAPYVPAAGGAVILMGTNDWPTALNGALLNSMRVIVAKLRCSAIFEDSHASWAFSGGSSMATALDSGMSGASRWGLNANAQTATFTVPSDVHNGATVDIFIGAITSTDAFTLTWTKNGVAVGTDVVVAGTITGEAQNAQVVRRVTGCNPGDVIQGTLSGLTGTCRIDCAGIEASPVQPIVICNVPRLPNNFAGLPSLTQAKCDNINTIWAQVAAEFGSQVAICDIDKALGYGDAKYFYTDQIHPYDLGGKVIADAIAYSFRSLTSVGDLGPQTSINGATLGLFTGWTNVSGEQPSAYRLTSANEVVLTGRIEHLTTGPTLGDTVAILPPGYRPKNTVTFLTTQVKATPSVACFTVDNAGLVKYVGGVITANCQASFDGIRFTVGR